MDISKELTNIGMELNPYYDETIGAYFPNQEQLVRNTLIFEWFRNTHGLYTHSRPEFYFDGINFNWQILWYSPKNEWSEFYCNDGTGLYGDNGEYPTQESANIAMIEKMIEIVKNK